MVLYYVYDVINAFSAQYTMRNALKYALLSCVRLRIVRSTVLRQRMLQGSILTYKMVVF